MINKTYTSRAFVLALGLALCSAVGARDREIEEVRELAASGELSVHNIAGDIRIRTWNKNQMHLTVRPGDSFERLEISGDANRLRVKIHVKDGRRNIDDNDLTLQVPKGIKLDIDAVSGDIEATGLSGDLRFKTVSGDVHLSANSRKVSVHTVSGDIELSAPSAETDLVSVSGDIRASGLRSRGTLESISGEITAEVSDVSRLDAQSVSGDIQLALSLAKGAEVSAQSLSGGVLLTLPIKSSAKFNMKTFSGDLGTRGFKSADRGAKRYRFTVGAGEADIDLNSFSGDVEIHGE